MTNHTAETIQSRNVYPSIRNIALGIHGAIRWFTDHVKNPFDKRPKKFNERQRYHAENYTLGILCLAHYTGGIMDENMLIDYCGEIATYSSDRSIQTQASEALKESFTRLSGYGKSDDWFTKRTGAKNQLIALFEESKDDAELQKVQNRIMFGLHLVGEKKLKALSEENHYRFHGINGQKIDFSQLDLAEIYQYLGLEGLKASFNFLQFLPELPQTQGLQKMFDFMDNTSKVKIYPKKGVKYTFFSK